jgi:hypothetical protein
MHRMLQSKQIAVRHIRLPAEWQGIHSQQTTKQIDCLQL